ncbi:MAG TPA: hypothetical protein VE055_05165 [Gaiellaceae bacterium]|nr:hypothetical protein [Gaiellaceae bacterium]
MPTIGGGLASPARRLNAPVVVRVEAHVDGSPRRVNSSPVALVREEWRVVDRWWTEEPVSRRYFDVVLAGGERAVVYRDEEVGRWFSQRGT